MFGHMSRFHNCFQLNFSKGNDVKKFLQQKIYLQAFKEIVKGKSEFFFARHQQKRLKVWKRNLFGGNQKKSTICIFLTSA